METQNTTTAQEPKPVRGQGVLEWYEALISAALVLVLVFSFFFRIIQVDGSSMVPTLVNGDKLIVWGAGYTPQRGDVVIVDSYTAYGKPLVKRVIAKGGDTVRVDVRIKEGDRERIQAFEGTVIAKKHGGVAETFTVRRVAYGVGIERVFPINSPFVEKVTVVRKGKVRRAKLFYLRGRTGKAAKVKSDI